MEFWHQFTMTMYNPGQKRGTRVSGCGNFIYLENGQKFKRTVLPSVAEPKKEADDIDIEAGLKEFDQIRTQEAD